MKKSICLLLTICLIAGAVCALVSCGSNPLDKASKNADNYTIVATYDDEAHILTATQTVEVTNRSENSFTAIKFHIYANAYREDAETAVVPATYSIKAYPNGKSYGDITFDYVKANDKAVAYTIEGQDLDILSVPVDELFPNQKVTIEMTYQIQLANIMHRLGYTDNTVNLGNFYPVLCQVENGAYATTPYYNIGDPYVTNVANFNVTLTAPQDYVVASSGNLVDASQTDNNATYKYEAQALREFAMVLSTKYKKLSQQMGDVQVNYYYYNDENAEQSLATAVGMLGYLDKTVGAYPYKQYTVCETDFCYGGMEYGALAMVTSGSQAYTEAIAHETAHQWFYGIVGNNQINNAWMDEGLADWMTYMYLDSIGAQPVDNSVKAITMQYVSYVDVLNHYYDNIDTSFRTLADYKNDSEYVMFTYVKGSLLFGTVYELMGANKFGKALQTYYNDAMFGIATEQTLINAFTQVGGTELGKIFTDYIDGKEIVAEIIE
ncbi:MAG: M1 family metallopeptidase [Clostridia bacterium]|nr:M1 family metallopeptidase [Clostridia bacterium]